MIGYLIAHFGITMFLLSVLSLLSYKYEVLLSGEVEDRWSKKPITLVGGLAIIIPFIFYFMFVFDSQSIVSFILFVSFFGSIFIGLSDDFYGLGAGYKFIQQVIYTGIFSYFYLSLPFHYTLLCILIIIGIVNSVNMFDNMDMVCGLAILPILVSFMILTEFGLFFGLLITSVLAFLIFNFKGWVYMGDTGSHFFGFLLGCFAAWFLFQDFSIQRIIGLVFVFGIFIADTLSVVIYRIYHKKPFWIGDKNHISHDLAELTTERKAQAIIFIVSVVFNSIGLKILGGV